MKVNQSKQKIGITPKGSLGLLAYGDIGLREWRKVKQEFHKKTQGGNEQK